MPYTYILKCSDGTYYTGWAVDLEARLRAHINGKGAHYTRARLPVELVYWESHPGRSAAQRREAAIRKLRRAEKKALLEAFVEGQGKPGYN